MDYPLPTRGGGDPPVRGGPDIDHSPLQLHAIDAAYAYGDATRSHAEEFDDHLQLAYKWALLRGFSEASAHAFAYGFAVAQTPHYQAALLLVDQGQDPALRRAYFRVL